jgi:hypothetical protein
MGHITHICDAPARNPPQRRICIFLVSFAVLTWTRLKAIVADSVGGCYRLTRLATLTATRLQPVLLPLRLRYLLLENHFLVRRRLLAGDVAIDGQHFLVE